MLMPVNYSVISDDELSYVSGGSLLDIMVPVMNTQNWQNVSKALVRTLGNAFALNTMGAVTQSFLNGDGFPTMYLYDNTGRSNLDVRKVLANVMGCAAMLWTFGQDGAGVGYSYLGSTYSADNVTSGIYYDGNGSLASSGAEA